MKETDNTCSILKNEHLKQNTSIRDLIHSELQLINNSISDQKCNDSALSCLTVLAEKIANKSSLKNGQTTNGNIYFLSIGKSVPMLEKVAATMRSLSFPAHVIDAVHILHGDFGMFTKDDLVIAVSKSGHTIELNNTLQYLKQKNVPFYYVTMANPSDETVNNLTKNAIFLSGCKEIDALNRIPTVSPIVFQIVFDAVGVYAAGVIDKMTIKEFLNNHPGGDIGKVLREIIYK